MTTDGRNDLIQICIGTLDVLKSELTNTAEPKIVTQGVFFNLNLIPRDSYGNTISNISENHLLVDIRKVNTIYLYTQNVVQGCSPTIKR